MPKTRPKTNIDHPDLSLELSNEKMERLVAETMRWIRESLASLEEQPVADFSIDRTWAHSLRESLPQKGTPFESLLELLFNRVLPKGINTRHPGFMGYIPSGSLPHSAAAALIIAVLNRWTGMYDFAPGLIELEGNVIRWLCDIMGLPKGSGGVLTSGGSMANFGAVVTARMEKLGDEFSKGVLYTSDQTHHSVMKSARLAGFSERNLRLIPSDAAFRIDIKALQAQIQKDKREGLRPFLLVGNAGTVNTGAIDNLVALKKIATQEKLWFHVDAAWGGIFRLTAIGKKRLTGLEKADSITFDPHKTLFVPYGCGALLMRDLKALKRTHFVEAPYLSLEVKEEEMWDFCNLSPELSRKFRGLYIWLPLKMHGIEPYRHLLEEKLELAAWAATELQKIPHVTLVAKPELVVIPFRVAPRGKSEKTANCLTEEVLDFVNADRRVFLSKTRLRDQTVLRLVPLAFNTHKQHVREAIETVREAVTALVRER